MTSATYDFGMPSGAPGRARRKAEANFARTFLTWFGGLFPSRATQLENEIETFIEHRGGILTDDIEREISRRYGSIAGR